MRPILTILILTAAGALAAPTVPANADVRRGRDEDIPRGGWKTRMDDECPPPDWKTRSDDTFRPGGWRTRGDTLVREELGDPASLGPAMRRREAGPRRRDGELDAVVEGWTVGVGQPTRM